MKLNVIPLCGDYVAADRTGAIATQTQMLPNGKLWNPAGLNYTDPKAEIVPSNELVFAGQASTVEAKKGFSCEGSCK